MVRGWSDRNPPYGFLPMQIFIGPFPGDGSNTPGSKFFGSGGDTLEVRTVISVKAALTSAGSVLAGFPIKDDGLSVCMSIEIPVLTHMGTPVRGLSSKGKNNEVIGTCCGCLSIHPASCSKPTIFLSNCSDSSSWKLLTVYSVPPNGFNAATTSLVEVIERGVLIALNFASASASLRVDSASLCSASASLDTAFAASCFAAAMSRAYESASFRASVARPIAFFDATMAAAEASCAFWEETWAPVAALAAPIAEVFASPAWITVSAKTSSSWARSLVSLMETSASNTPSPTTPKITSSRPIAAIGTRQPGSGLVPSFLRLLHSFRSDQVSGISSTHPIATPALAINRHENQNPSFSSSEDRIESTTGDELPRRLEKEKRVMLIFVTVTGAVCGSRFLYCFRRTKADRENYGKQHLCLVSPRPRF